MQIRVGAFSRAVRDPKTGKPLDARIEASWRQSALALTTELEGDLIAEMDPRGFDSSTAIFERLDPGYTHLGDSSIRSISGTPLTRYSRSRPPTKDIIDTSPSDISSIDEDPSAFISMKMGTNIDPSSISPSTTWSTPSRSSTIALPLSSESGPSYRRNPLPPPIGTVKRQLLQTGDSGAGDGAKKDDLQGQRKRKSDYTPGKSTKPKQGKLETVHEGEEHLAEGQQHEEQAVPEVITQI